MSGIDLHTHSTVSDGTDSPSELVANAAASGLDVIGLCDHDTIDGWDEALTAGEAAGVRVLRGIEMSCDLKGVSIHLLAYGTRAQDAELAAELARNRAGRSERVPTMLARLAEHGLPVPEEVLYRHVGDSPSVGRPHFADAMVELGYVADRRQAFDQWLADDQPIYVARYSTDLETALDLVRAAGGATVIAHPWGRSSRASLPTRYLASLVASRRLDGIEVDHNDHDDQTRAELRALATTAYALITGSSDYHGAGKQDHDLGCNTTSPEVLAELERRVHARGGLL
ncbi:MAG: PHP domain-containing protein [Propionicimonas sp.]|uniref:PHP domain-containing protein n=1 Tax=Propionicimonas sp. TaxID=1955623 RepID=UPI0025CE6F2B|nr:PHP domain-containing protein [Propionicimonas sp.]MBU4187204.1 PHP domain-containing protein [Actinomycetota bacterium]MBU4207497.1 PHP domain-containing protein [Actinomycetota bacterium]MBU4410837.1 PHP domain-containing protein [Actinomycetota bacterium]MBU4588458.1 PHP domain-containing protein [Actinomycetota bacterium]MCG2804252.1 PHP domain-containing protein [Propionicimonas sp.]